MMEHDGVLNSSHFCPLWHYSGHSFSGCPQWSETLSSAWRWKPFLPNSPSSLPLNIGVHLHHSWRYSSPTLSFSPLSFRTTAQINFLLIRAPVFSRPLQCYPTWEGVGWVGVEGYSSRHKLWRKYVRFADFTKAYNIVWDYEAVCANEGPWGVISFMKTPPLIVHTRGVISWHWGRF